MNKYDKYKLDILGQMARIKKPRDMDLFLQDILTSKEYEDVVFRWQILKELQKGKPQREIAKKLKVSIAKITRGSRVLLNKKGLVYKLLHKKK